MGKFDIWLVDGIWTAVWVKGSVGSLHGYRGPLLCGLLSALLAWDEIFVYSPCKEMWLWITFDIIPLDLVCVFD